MITTGDVIDFSNVEPKINHPYNTLYRITGITPGSSKEVQVSSASTVSGASGIGVTDTLLLLFKILVEHLMFLPFNYNKDTGVGVVTTTENHGLRVNNKIKIEG